MEENMFWLQVWRTAALVVSVLVVTIGGCTVNKQRVMAEMVEKGADPIRAHCAVYLGDSTDQSVCVLMATKKD